MICICKCEGTLKSHGGHESVLHTAGHLASSPPQNASGGVNQKPPHQSPKCPTGAPQLLLSTPSLHEMGVTAIPDHTTTPTLEGHRFTSRPPAGVGAQYSYFCPLYCLEHIYAILIYSSLNKTFWEWYWQGKQVAFVESSLCVGPWVLGLLFHSNFTIILQGRQYY